MCNGLALENGYGALPTAREQTEARDDGIQTCLLIPMFSPIINLQPAFDIKSGQSNHKGTSPVWQDTHILAITKTVVVPARQIP